MSCSVYNIRPTPIEAKIYSRPVILVSHGCFRALPNHTCICKLDKLMDAKADGDQLKMRGRRIRDPKMRLPRVCTAALPVTDTHALSVGILKPKNDPYYGFVCSTEPALGN